MCKTIHSSLDRRGFLRGVGSGALAAATARCIGGEPITNAPTQRFLREYGFWEYTTPRAGGSRPMTLTTTV